MNITCPITYEAYSFGSLHNFQDLTPHILHPVAAMPTKSFLGTAFMPRNFARYTVSEQRIVWLAALHKTGLLTVSAKATPTEHLMLSSYWRIHAVLVYLNRQTSLPPLPTYSISPTNTDCASLVLGWLTEIENFVSIGRAAYSRNRLDLGLSALERRFDRQLANAGLRSSSKALFSTSMLEFAVSQLAINSADDRAFYVQLLRADVIQLAALSQNPYMDFLDLQDYLYDWHSDSVLRLRLLSYITTQLSVLEEFGFMPAAAKLEAETVDYTYVNYVREQRLRNSEWVDPDPLTTPPQPRHKAISFTAAVMPLLAPAILRSNYPTFTAYIAALQAAKTGGLI